MFQIRIWFYVMQLIAHYSKIVPESAQSKGNPRVLQNAHFHARKNNAMHTVLKLLNETAYLVLRPVAVRHS
jgi:hypothetical protein